MGSGVAGKAGNAALRLGLALYNVISFDMPYIATRRQQKEIACKARFWCPFLTKEIACKARPAAARTLFHEKT